jgi:hypothetical protein
LPPVNPFFPRRALAAQNGLQFPLDFLPRGINKERLGLMSQNYKPNQVKPVQSALFELPLAEVHPKERERVEQLIAGARSGPAVDFAKDVHKRRQSAASEALLLDAYGARISSLLERSLDKEAKAIMDLVLERYPSARQRSEAWNAAFAARRGDLDALLEPLNDPGLPPDKHAAIAALVRRDVVDLRALAECRALAAEHPLRTAAAALHKAFEAVTSGPVTDDPLALPEVSRHSPLASWKLLVRAIAAFYRRDDRLCQQCLAAIEADSAAARLLPALQVLISQKDSGPKPRLTSAAIALVSQAGGNLENLRGALARLDQALQHRNQPLILQEIHSAVAACRQAEPGLLERLKQHISVRAITAGLKAEKVAAAMDGPSLRNAYFWRLVARAAEEEKGRPMAIPHACSLWEEFRRHAIHEGWFPAKGPEVAALYLHMADLLHHVPDEELEEIRLGFAGNFKGHADYYRGQPPGILALAPRRGVPDLYFLSPFELLERTCEADASAQNFQRWLGCVAEGSPHVGDAVAERWCAALPNDIPPVLHLMQSAEKRNSLQKAFKFMERAERIDGLNPEVRRARLRLLVSMAARHLRQKKPHLAEPELRQLEALPQVRQGDRAAFVAALRSVWCELRGAPRESASAYDEAVRLLGDGVTTHLLFLQVGHWCGGKYSAIGKAPPPTVPLFAALGRVCALGDDMGMPVEFTQGMSEQMMRELSKTGVSGNVPALAALGEAAMRQNDAPLAYAIAGAGLAQGAEGQARFLFLRARALPPWEEERSGACLAAASELARRQRDADLLNHIGECRDEEMDLFGLPPDAANAATMSTGEIGRVVQRETLEPGYPTSRPVTADDEDCPCAACCAARAELPAELIGMMEELGPEVVAKAMAEMLGIGGKRKRGGRRRPVFGDGEVPF